jgi:tRNA-specific 2-thiouridylase
MSREQNVLSTSSSRGYERELDTAVPVVVAMSGGVDSCAAALMLEEQGVPVIGVSMQVWDYRKNGGNAKRATCCAPSDFDDAREIAESRGFPFYVFDFEDSFHESVISPFVQSYLNGNTPNPCLDCNRKVKFRQLRQRAAVLGAQAVATGHYARIRTKDDGTRGLYTGRDLNKDQSYFLYAMTQHDLAHTLFPVGDLDKSEVRSYLDERGFAVASKDESQDICFVGSTVGEFIEKESGRTIPQGQIREQDGRVLGTHRGVHQYTVGQRKGLGLSSPHPLYVLSIDTADNAITVGAKEDLARSGFTLGDVNWISGSPPADNQEFLVKMRYRHDGVRCAIEAGQDGSSDPLKLRFCDEWSAVSPGQAAVFYALDCEGDGAREVFGGGIILKEDS